MSIEQLNIEKVLVAGNRGGCGGVNMALEVVEQVLNIVDGRELVYTNWGIVNNKPITSELEERGLHNVSNDFSKVPNGSIMIYSAHGVPPSFFDIAKEKDLTVVNATCQLVNRQHTLVRVAERAGKHTIFIGADGHPETVGVMGEVNPLNITLVEKVEDVDQLNLPKDKPKVVYSQTTLLPDEVVAIEEALKRSYPETEIPSRLDICYAMYNRQAAAEDLLQKGIQRMIVVGSKNSHNTQGLKKKGEKAGILSYTIDTPEEIQLSWFPSEVRVVGLTSGASVLDRFFIPVVQWFQDQNPNVGIEYQPQVIEEEEMTFKLPQAEIDKLYARYAA